MAATRSIQLSLLRVASPLSRRLGDEFFRALPATPGVYFFHASQGELLYIGQSSNLRARIGSYRHVTLEKGARRTLRLVRQTARIEWKICATAEEAVAEERSLLLQHRPPFNRAGVWQGEPWWLSLKHDESRLEMRLTRESIGIGPLPSSFRHLYGSLLRCVFRMSFPARPISQFPLGIFDARTPLSACLEVPRVAEMAAMTREFIEGGDGILAEFETVLPALPSAEQAYWKDEIQLLRRGRTKLAKMNFAPLVTSADCFRGAT